MPSTMSRTSPSPVLLTILLATKPAISPSTIQPMIDIRSSSSPGPSRPRARGRRPSAGTGRPRRCRLRRRGRLVLGPADQAVAHALSRLGDVVGRVLHVALGLVGLALDLGPPVAGQLADRL